MREHDQQARVAARILKEEPLMPTEIFNLTRHNPNWDQKIMGVVQAGSKVFDEIQQLMTFEEEIPDTPELQRRAERLAKIAKLSGCEKALIGGPSFFMSILEAYLIFEGILPVFAFNTKSKSGVWKFQGFVESALAEWWL